MGARRSRVFSGRAAEMKRAKRRRGSRVKNRLQKKGGGKKESLNKTYLLGSEGVVKERKKSAAETLEMYRGIRADDLTETQAVSWRRYKKPGQSR